MCNQMTRTKRRALHPAVLIALLGLLALVVSCGSSDGNGETTAPLQLPDPAVAPAAASSSDDHDDDDHDDADHDDDDHDDADHGDDDDHDDDDHDDADHDDDDHDDADHDDDDHDDADHGDDDHDDADHDDDDHDDDDHDDDDHDDAAAADDTVDSADADVAVANAGYLGSYTLVDESFGTQVTVAVQGATRTIASNTLPNHETGDFPNSGNPNTISAQDRTWTLTTEPTFIGQARDVREPGVALNGVKFEPGTAETVPCATGENYRIEGLQDMFNLGMDFNNAHVQPTGEYHYHGVSDMLVDAFANDQDLVLVGFAADGHLIYYSKSNAYAPSYALATDARTGTDCAYRTGAVDLDGTNPDGTYVSDWVFTAGQGDLDECNGTVIGDEYAYVITEQYPYISRCLMGEFTEVGPGGGAAGGPPPGAAPGGAGPGGQDGDRDLAGAAAALGISEQELQQALGTPPPDFAATATTLDMIEADLREVLVAYGLAPAGA